MNKRAVLFLAIGMAASVTRAAEDPATFPDERAKASYSVGVNMGTQMKREKLDLDLDLILKGIKDTLAGQPLLTEQEVRDAWTGYNQKHRKDLAETNKLAGQAFLAENKKKDGIQTLGVTLADGTKSELQYKELAEGKGD